MKTLFSFLFLSLGFAVGSPRGYNDAAAGSPRGYNDPAGSLRGYNDPAGSLRGYNDPACQAGRQVIVHLFEWKWDDIAKECEEYLGPKGYCGVQVSPPNEHITGNTWWTRYQPVSYKLESRSGSRSSFTSMVSRCAAVGVNIVVDGVINHMSGLDHSGTGTGGSSYDGGDQSYPGVPFSNLDFHQPICYINNYGDPTEVRNCYLVGLNDLAGGQSYVQEKIAGFLQDCVDIGVTGFRIDAAKHMWPDDIKGTIDRVGDLPSGGRPFFFHEVIDQGGEPIKVQEYFGVGGVTEFRYGIKVADAIRNGNYAALGGVYDQGWGMADPAHAVVFLDNHDNQRGHGGGGSLLTHDDPYNYKLGTSFMLAHDYGYKRVMSSYYFSDTDQGPPSNSPGCGGDWACEHRWASIGNMVQFTNAVAGTGVENWVAGSDKVAFSRGNKGFYAMGKMDGEYSTGLPDGEYCDIISECKQTITISGGKGYFKAHSGDEPVVAICVGCGKSEPGTTHKPPHTTHKPATTHRPDHTTAKPAPTTTVKTTVPATTAPGFCCSDVVVSSSGGVRQHYPELLGKYSAMAEENGRDVFKHSTILFTAHLHYTTDPLYKWEGWMITMDANNTFGYIANEGDRLCPVGLRSGWEFQLPSGWVEDPTFQITCEGDPTSPPDPTGGPTGGPTTAKPTQPPGPDGVARTIVVVEKVTKPGSDVFIVGGVAPDKMIDISIHAMPAIWERQNAWMVGDDHLDWDGPEPGQGTFEIEGTDYEAFGTAAAWTTDDVTKDYYYELNQWDDHFWFIDMDMDCGQTQGGWFEFNTIFTIGGEDGEPAVSQDDCTGDVGGTAPFTSTNHIARCGFINVFSYGKDKCQIDNVPA